jgi:hypothetical protein
MFLLQAKVALAVFGYPVRPYASNHPPPPKKNMQIIWFPNIFILSVSDDGYSRNVSCTLK